MRVGILAHAEETPSRDSEILAEIRAIRRMVESIFSVIVVVGLAFLTRMAISTLLSLLFGATQILVAALVAALLGAVTVYVIDRLRNWACGTAAARDTPTRDGV